MLKSTKIVNRIMLPRVEDGGDWDVERVLIARMTVNGQKDMDLFWWPGHTCWQGRGVWGYTPGELRIFKHVRKVNGTYRREDIIGTLVQKEGRLSKKMLLSNAAKIDKEFGDGITALLNPLKTLLIEATEEQ